MLNLMSAHKPRIASASGLSLLEVTIAIAVVSIAISALVVISNAAIRSVNDSRNNAIADQYVRQALEATRVNRDQNGWAQFVQMPNAMDVGSYRAYSLNGTNLVYHQTLTGSAITASPCTSHANSSDYLLPGTNNFYQSVVLYRKSTSEMIVTANVCYPYGGSHTQLSSAQTILTDWQ